ncbi:MAG: hypothetical protein E7358_00315 [Clostridiales bacterium]|nr:hypothetical protein [Clostridiales bacterium]
MKKQLELCRIKLFADSLKKGKSWNGYEVYEPIYKEEYIGGHPKIVLVKDGEVRLSTSEECFAYMEFVKSKGTP